MNFKGTYFTPYFGILQKKTHVTIYKTRGTPYSRNPSLQTEKTHTCSRCYFVYGMRGRNSNKRKLPPAKQKSEKITGLRMVHGFWRGFRRRSPTREKKYNSSPLHTTLGRNVLLYLYGEWGGGSAFNPRLSRQDTSPCHDIWCDASTTLLARGGAPGSRSVSNISCACPIPSPRPFVLPVVWCILDLAATRRRRHVDLSGTSSSSLACRTGSPPSSKEKRWMG